MRRRRPARRRLHIAASLERAHALPQDGLEIGSADAACKIQEIAAADTVQRLQHCIAESCRSRFAEFAGHGAAVAAGATDVLGQLQYLDVVRQCVAELVARVLADYLAGEAMHGDGGNAAGSGPAIELF